MSFHNPLLVTIVKIWCFPGTRKHFSDTRGPHWLVNMESSDAILFFYSLICWASPRYLFLAVWAYAGLSSVTTDNAILLMPVHTKLSSFGEHVLGWDREKWVRSPTGCCAAARLACKNAMVCTGWGNSHSGYIKRLRKHNSHFVGIHFWQGRLLVFWVGVCQPRMVTVTCSLISRHGWGYKRAYFAWNALGMSIGVRTQAEMKIWCIESMYMLKVVSMKNAGVKRIYY